MVKPIKLIIVTPGFAKNETHTSCLPYLQNFILALKNTIGAGNIKVFALHFPFTSIPYFWHGIEIIPLNGQNKKGLFQLIIWHRANSHISKFIKLGFTCIQSFWLTETTFIAQQIASKYRLPHIATMMGQDANCNQFIMRFVQLKKIQLVALSQFHANQFFKATGLLVNTIIPFPLSNTTPIKSMEERTIHLLFVGSFIEIKQPLQFIDAVAHLCQKYGQIKAVMIGDGKLLPILTQKIEVEQLQQVITVLDVLSQEVVFEYMQKSKILLHTSAFEGQCLVYSEALANGMYVVSYAVGKIENTTKHKVCSSYLDLLEKCAQLFEQQLDHAAFQSINTQDCINHYLTMYQQQSEMKFVNSQK